MRQRIIICDIDKPRITSHNEELRWICESLGLITGRDVENISFKIMCKLLEKFRNQSIVGTEIIASALKVEAPRVNHHIRNLIESGIIFREKRKIALRGRSLTAAIEEMRKDSERMFNELIGVSKKIDISFGLEKN